MEMDSWQDIQREIMQAGAKKGVPGDWDGVRRESYNALVALTGRPLIVYASAFHVPGKPQIAGASLSIDLSDKEGFQEVVRNIDAKAVDVFVHSPGGSAEATESIVEILRSKYSDIRFIVTGTAKSAATMMVMSGNRILMTDGAELGPTDPQELFGAGRASPAGAILDQFNIAKKEVAKDPSLIGPWLPVLQQCGPSLIVECQNHIKLSQTLVAGWLTEYMFKNDKAAAKKAGKLARYLSNHKIFLSHGRRVDLKGLRAQGALVDRIEDFAATKPELYRAFVRVHLTIMATLDGTSTVKLFENSSGAALIRMVQQQQINIPFLGGFPGGPQQLPVPRPTP